jgi:hypothetical protein
MNERVPLRVRVEVPAAPAPGLLRAAIERRLAGSAFPAGPEDAVGRAVADAVAARERGTKS